MKTILTKIAVLAVLSSFQGYAQGVSEDSMQALNQQKQNIEVNKRLNERKTELAKLENNFVKKTQDAEKAATEARNFAAENQQAADKLRQDPQNKAIAAQANKAARQAERSSKSVRKANDDLRKLSEDIESLKEKIREEEGNLDSQSINLTSATTNNAASVPTQIPSQKEPSEQVTMRNGRVDSEMAKEAPRSMADKIVESTFKNYPQQQGQPNIIINNIIVPSDYDRPKPTIAAQPESVHSMSSNDSEYEEFKAWQRQRNNAQQAMPEIKNQNFVQPNSPNAERPQNVPVSEDRLTLRERFGEKPGRNSGLWVIPVAGIHASDFKADLKDGEADGRIGWNAGLDFRVHAKRFFVQPGVHYFSSSMKVTSEDSVSSAPLLTGPRIHSLKVPVLLGLYLTKANKGFFKANIKGGATGTYVIDVDKNNLAQFDKANIEEFSYGLNAGLGLEFGFITLDITHEWGMTALFKENNIKNNVLRATIGFKL